MKQAICDRLNAALEDMYHNASPDYPWSLMEEYDRLMGEGAAMDLFNHEAGFEVEHLNAGGPCGLIPYGDMKHNADKSPAHKRLLNREYARDAGAEKWLPILEHGKLYSWGRGGRTLAPDGLINQHGGSSFSIKQYDCEDMSNADAVVLIQAVEAFNAYVASWCSKANLVELFKERISEARAELRHELAQERRRTLSLLRDAKAQRRAAGPICDLIRQTVTASLENMAGLKAKLA